MLAFVTLLAMTPTIFAILASPVLPIFVQQASTVYRFSTSDLATRQLWWDWWGSWIVFGGPVGRYFGGLILGYIRYPITASKPNSLLEGPNGRLAGLVFPGALISLFTMVSSNKLVTSVLFNGARQGLLVSMLHIILGGELTVERARRRMFERAKANLNHDADLLGHTLDPRRYLFFADADQDEPGVYTGRVIRTSNRPFERGTFRDNWNQVVKHRDVVYSCRG